MTGESFTCESGTVRLPCLTVIQPWASLIVLGLKRVETRNWRPDKAPLMLAIHASARWSPAQDKFTFLNRAVFSALAGAGLLDPQSVGGKGSIPLGAVVGTVSLSAAPDKTEMCRADALRLSAMGWGDGDHGRFAWLLERPFRFAAPLHASGKRGLWEIDIPAESLGPHDRQLSGDNGGRTVDLLP